MQKVESMPAVITLERPVVWRYDAQPMNATCLLYGDIMPVCVSLTSRSAKEVPDVVLVDEWLRRRLKEPTTAEGLAVETAQRWGFDCEVRGGPTERHGVITATAPAR